MNDFIGDWHALVVLVIAGVIPNQIWRMLGLWLGSGLDDPHTTAVFRPLYGAVTDSAPAAE